MSKGGILLLIVLIIPFVVSADVWHVKRVDYEQGTQTIIGYGSSLKLDSNGNPHISYFDSECDSVKYAHWDGTGWIIESIDEAFWALTSLALDSDDYGFISYQNVNGDDLNYAWFDGVNWHIGLVDSAGDVGSTSSLALDTEGYPHVSYRDDTDTALLYAYMDSRGWNYEVVDEDGNVGMANSLALDGDVNPHISYRSNNDSDQYSLCYAYKGESGWELENVYSDYPYFWCGVITSIAIDSSDYPHIGFINVDNLGGYKFIRHAYKDETGWHSDGLFLGALRGDVHVSLALTSDDTPYVAVDAHESGNEWERILYFCYKSDSNWIHEEIPGSGGSWGSLSIDIDSYDRPHISYHKWFYDGLHYAYMAPNQVELRIGGSSGTSTLSWVAYPGASIYEIHGVSNDPYFYLGPHSSVPTFITTVPSSQLSWDTTNGMGDPDENWNYIVMAKDETDTELAISNRVGELDFVTNISP